MTVQTFSNTTAIQIVDAKFGIIAAHHNLGSISHVRKEPYSTRDTSDAFQVVRTVLTGQVPYFCGVITAGRGQQ